VTLDEIIDGASIAMSGLHILNALEFDILNVVPLKLEVTLPFVTSLEPAVETLLEEISLERSHSSELFAVCHTENPQ
jgi:hypothetical protein